MSNAKTIQELIERHMNFWNMENEEPLMRVGRHTPLQKGSGVALGGGAVAEEGDVVLPEKIDVAAYVERHTVPSTPINGDFLSGIGPPGFCWTEAMMGCTIRSVSGSVWSEPPPFDWDRIEEFKLAEDNPWLEKLREFTRALVARADGRCPVVQPLLRGPVDILASVLGDEEMTLAFYDHPDEMETLLDLCTDTFLRAANARLDLTPEFHGGYLSAYGIWAPGKTVRTQADNAILLSPKLYRERMLPYERRVIEAFDCSLIHLHSGVVHVVTDALMEVEALRAIQVSVDYPGGPLLPEILPILSKILEAKPLILTGPVPQSDLDRMLDVLPSQGLCVQVTLVEE